MTASDYPVTFPYGETGAPYSAARPHRGDDRGCPTGTPIVIGGQTIGLTGNTGYSTGAHLHIQEWSGGYANTRKPQNSFQPGVVVNVDPTGSQGDGSFGKFITIQTEDGWNDTYCHLSEINVQVGQVIGDNMSEESVKLMYWMVFDRDPDAEQYKFFTGRNADESIANIFNSSDFKNRIAAVRKAFDDANKKPVESQFVKVSDLYIKKG